MTCGIDSRLEAAPVGLADAVEITRLRPLTREAGLGLGERACIALGRRTGSPVLTADVEWSALDLEDVSVRVIG